MSAKLSFIMTILCLAGVHVGLRAAETAKPPSWVVIGAAGDREAIYDKNSITRSDGIAQITTGVNFLKGGKFEDLEGVVYSMITISQFNCSQKLGRNIQGSFYTGMNASGRILRTQKPNDTSWADISKNAGLMRTLEIACK